MSFTDHHLEERLMQLRVQEEHHQAELCALQREARIANPRWLDRQRCWLLCQLGRRLVSSGTRLLEAGLPDPLPQGK